jgi:hypothetical protein
MQFEPPCLITPEFMFLQRAIGDQRRDAIENFDEGRTTIGEYADKPVLDGWLVHPRTDFDAVRIFHPQRGVTIKCTQGERFAAEVVVLRG